jgi:hypothetical protein
MPYRAAENSKNRTKSGYVSNRYRSIAFQGATGWIVNQPIQLRVLSDPYGEA